MLCATMREYILFVIVLFNIYGGKAQQNDYDVDLDYLDMDPDSLLAESALITANATCGQMTREHYCRLVEHAGYDEYKRTKRQVYEYSKPQTQDARTFKDVDGSLVECNFCDARDRQLKHPIEYAVSGDSDSWWQSPSLAEGLRYHAVTIDIDLKQVYQIVFVLLRMGDSPRPANWILEKSIDGFIFEPWVFFSESAEMCRKLYQPMINSTLQITSDSRPNQLRNDEVYCTTYFSQPQNLQAGEIIVPLTMDREGSIKSYYETNQPVDPDLIEFLSARFVRLKFQKLQTLSGDWMTLPDLLDPSVYNRYYYSIRNIKVGGKCICNSHANQCDRKIINGVPRAVCECKHNTCGHTCERCCPLFNQQPWRPGGLCEACNCHGKADSCVYNQTVANLQLSLNQYRVREGGGVCINCREQTTGVNCEDCIPGYYRPMDVGPDAKNPCVSCNCNIHGSTGFCVSNDALMPHKQPGDCICRPGFEGRRCERCAEGFYQSLTNPTECVACPCDLSGSQPGDGYRCQPPCNCKANVDHESLCRTCLPEHFNLDQTNAEGCQSCFCMGLSKDCKSVSVPTARRLEMEGRLGTVATMRGWELLVPGSASKRTLPITPITLGDNSHSNQLRVLQSEVEFGLGPSASVSGQAYYWSAPKDYLGKQLTAYHGKLEMISRFGSPSGRTGVTGSRVQGEYSLSQVWIDEPDLIFEGHGIRLAHSVPSNDKSVHRVIRVDIYESAFRVLVEANAESLDRIPIRQTQAQEAPQHTYRDPTARDRYGSVNFATAGRPATIVDIMTVLSNLSHIYVKAKYTDDQSYIELRRVALERAERANITNGVQKGVLNIEECKCPPGHTGTSCEDCMEGYWRDPKITPLDQTNAVDAFFSLVNPIYKRACVACECNGRSNKCDANTGHCLECDFNTFGPNCNECAPGFHMDLNQLGSNVCQPCECPILTNQKTNFCVAFTPEDLTFPKHYACIDCNDNTRGQFCEKCIDFYYGNPLLEQPCRPCDCGAAATGCDEVTGECKCGFNTAGPRCTVCESGSHGDPSLGKPCNACGCHPKGSLSVECDRNTGLCSCQMFYEGKHCDRCVSGRGNVEAGCPFCACDPLGSIPQANASCDPVTGQCVCKPGVGGSRECDRCDDGFYNMGSNGCQECECSNRALKTACHAETGQCFCGENVVGKKCDRCLPGHYWNGSEPHCLDCNCGPGATGSECDPTTGQCRCAPYVTGRACDLCEAGFWGASPTGCQRCPRCPNGLVCDQLDGKCICPVNTEGDQCETCSKNSWDHNPVIGCKNCDCSDIGSVDSSQGCDLVTGQCGCKHGFAGRACDECQAGYYDYPNCQPCMCNLGGSVRNTTIGLDSLTCNPITGACHCKPNVRGEKCDECRPGSFGLDPDYPLGCYACFCFPTSNDATCAQLTGYRSVPGPEHKLQLVSTDNQYLPGGPLVDLELSLQASSGSTDLPDLTQGQNQFKWRFSTNVPTFLKLPNLSGSHTRSYGSIFVELHSDCLPSGKCGIVEENGYDLQATQAVPDRTVREDPQMIHAQMTALNGQLEFEYQPVTPPPRTPVASGDLGAEYYPIWMKESEWVLTRIQTQSIRVRPSRAALMLALTNITSFNVRLFMPQANPKFVSVNYRIRNAVSESLTQLGTSITTIETCTCANNANGDHCEIPYDLSFFPPIIIKPRPDGNYFDDLVDPSRPMPSVNGSTSAGGTPSFDYDGGSVRICECHGKAVACDKDTGSCLSCKDHTAGSSCEVCEQGYYGDPIKGIPCVKCRCPTEATDYAKSCHPIDPLRPSSQFVCDCMPGFVGNTCDRCDSGYYGDPLMMIPCTPCNCNPEGSRNQHCNMKTGQCTCLPGIIGRRCDECPKGFVVEGGRCIDCRGECTGELLQRADTVELEIDNQDINELANQGLDHLEKRAEALKSRYSMPTIQREGVLIEQASKLTSDLSRIVLLTFSSLPHNAARLDNTSCVQSNATAQLSRDTVALGRRLDDWLTGMQSLRPGPVDEETSKMWHESARMIRQVISRIDLSPTKEWADELLKISRPLETQLKAIENRMKNSNFGPQIDRLQHYQDEQGAHLDGQEQQLYQMANATLDGIRNIKEAQERMQNIQDIMNTAEGGSLDKLRENQTNLAANITRLKQIVVNYETSTIPKLDKLTNDLEQAQLFEQIPNSIPPDVIFKADNLERTLNDIVTALDVPGVEKAIEGREAYKMIADTLLKARNVTDEAMMNVDEAKTNESVDSLLNAVKKRHSSLSDRVKQLGDGVVSENLVVRNNDERLQNLDSSFKGILQVLQRTLSASDLTNQMSEKLKPLVASTKPEMEFLTSEVAEERRRLDILEEEVRSVEKRYNEMEGTANLAINQANSTQQSLINAIEKTEQRFYDLEKKMTSTRHLSALARSLLDLTYASLGKDPIPLRMKGAGCVYTLIPYHLTKSRVFDLELWFTPGLDRVASVGSAASQRVRGDVVILAGRRAFPGRTVMFALTVEETGLLRFSWSQPESSEGFKYLELGPVNATTTSRIRVNAISGKVSFYVQEIPEGVDTLDYLPVQKVAYTDEQSLITSHLMVDNQLEIRVGGPFHSTVIGGPLMESWGENGAEELWTRLQKMGNAYGCLFNLKVSGHMMGFQDFAKADTSCTQQTNDVCKIHTNFRPLIRNGLVWQKQPPLEAGLEPHPRPAMKERRDPRLEYMALHDFAAEDSYVRISDFAELNVCDKTLDVQLQKLSPNQADSMVLTFYNYREDYGITLESKNNELVATRWQGDLMQPRTSSTVIGKMQNFPKTSMFTNYWTLGKPFATDCAVAKQDELVIYLGGLPPGHFELRKRMKELGLTTTGFRGRIGLKNSFDSIPAALYADYFTKKPIKNYCDSRFSDIWQSGESFGVPNANPSGQYCLTLVPSPDYTIFELDPRLFRAPWTPEISMTVRFHPIGIGEISLLRMQFKDSQWLRIWLTPDLRVGLGIPEPYVSMKLITTEIFGTPMIQDPTNSLAALKAREAHVFNQSLFTEAILTIRFGDKDSKTLTVLFDQRPVQTWTLKKAIPETDILQVLVGPEFHPKLLQNHQELSINNLVIGQRRVDFETDMRSVSRGRSSHRFGECGSQLRPRFVPQDNKVQANLVYQGLDLPTPPVGRRLRSIFEHCEENGNVCDSVNENFTTEWPSIIHSLLSPKPSRRVRVRSSSGGNEIINKNCIQEQKSSAWFDGKSASYWNVNGVQNTLVNAGVKMFRLEIGFRLQPVREETNTVAVLAAFEFVSDQENLFVVTSGDRIYLIHKSSSYFGKTFSWTSPILDLQESAWHRLELISDEDGRVQFIFDSYEIWIEEGIAWGVPTAAYIGGYPLSQSLQLPRTSVPVPIQSLFGCVDELALGGRRFDVAKSKRPVCPTCFVINANAVHIPATVREVIQPERGILLPMNFPVNKRVNQPMEKIKFDFEVLYNPEKVGIESLFVLVFQERNNEDPVRLWVYLDRFKLVVTDMSTDARISFGVSKAEPNAWHFASISIESDAGMSVVTVSKQGESGVLVIFSTIGDLLSIFYAYDDVITPKAESEKHYGVAVPPFTGCLRKLQISIDGSKSVAVSFPPNSPSLIYGVCPL